jgi:DNA-binding winged helix-turn-helix (wHTH) protein
VGVNTSKGLVRFEAFELDLGAGELRKAGATPVRLPEQPFRILTMLLEHPGKVVSREEIRKKLGRMTRSWSLSTASAPR